MLICGSRPLADARTISAGTGSRVVEAVSQHGPVLFFRLHLRGIYLFDGPKLLPPELLASYGFPRAEGRPWKYRALVKCLTDERGTNDFVL